MIKAICMLACAMSIANGPASAQVIDLRNQSDRVGETELAFCSRPSPDKFGLPGHAFVGFSEKPVGGPRIFRAVGHTVATGASPAAAAFSYFGGSTIAGRRSEERYTHMKQACLTVKVNRVDYLAALGAARPTLVALGIPDTLAASAERYALNGNDCIDFVVKVASTLKVSGLKVPARGALDRPAGYINKLARANR